MKRSWSLEQKCLGDVALEEKDEIKLIRVLELRNWAFADEKHTTW